MTILDFIKRVNLPELYCTVLIVAKVSKKGLMGNK